MRYVRTLALVVLALSCACGGGSRDGGKESPFYTRVLPVMECGSCVDGTLWPGFDVGDTAFDEPVTALLRFNISSLPNWATNISARLVLVGLDIDGVPEPSLGDLFVDHLRLRRILKNMDCRMDVLQDSLAVVAPGDEVSAEVGVAVANDLAANWDCTCFRLRYAIPTDGDGVMELRSFWLELFGNHTQLEITYQAW